jgi:hypothetical protein
VPESLGAIEVHREQEAADEGAGERRVVAQTCQGSVRRTAEQIQQRRQKERGPSDPADEEIEGDPPAPMR